MTDPCAFSQNISNIQRRTRVFRIKNYASAYDRRHLNSLLAIAPQLRVVFYTTSTLTVKIKDIEVFVDKALTYAQ